MSDTFQLRKPVGNAFNFDATYQVENGSMFLRQRRGLIDSLHRTDDVTFKRYKQLVSQNWDENEYPLEQSRDDFGRYPILGEMVINNVGWQWSGDSNAANALVPMVAPFSPCSDAWLWFMEQGSNEGLHALSYSEIVRLAVPGGMGAIERVHKDFDTMRRVNYIASVFGHIILVGTEITQGKTAMDSQEASDALMLMAAAIFIFERGQFMASFANTAAIEKQGSFNAPCLTVRKIAMDEWNTHIPQCRYIIENEMKVPERMASLRRVRPFLEHLAHEVLENEVLWNKRQFALMKGDQLLGVTESMCENYIYYAGQDIAHLLGLNLNIPEVMKNPLIFMDKWLDPNSEQRASMEGKGTNYLVNSLRQSADQSGSLMSDLDLE